MSTDECIHLMPPAQCSYCNGREARERAAELAASSEVVATFEAKYAGPCGRCGDWFDSGERICKTEDGRYLHADCAAMP